MPEIVFIHCQTFARKLNRAGQSVSQIIAEGLRTGGYHPHVSNPRRPVMVFGDAMQFRRLHDDHVTQRKTRVMKNGRVSVRAIRADRHTLFTIVSSYPMPTESVEASSEEQIRFKRWLDLTLQWVLEQYGTQLKTAFVHLDEAYPHVHFWLLPNDPSADAALLHPGKVAKRATEARLKSAGTPPREAVKAGNRALKAAMRDWIDAYHREVGVPLGMLRDGPRRRRLSRAQHQAEIAMVAHHRNLREDLVRLEAKIAMLKAAAEVMDAQQQQIETKAAAFVERAKKHHARMRAEVEQVNALGPMLDAIVTEIDNRTMTFHPTTGWRVHDPRPFRAAGRLWPKLEPVIRRLVALMQSAEDGSWKADTREPDPHPVPFPRPASLQPSLSAEWP